MVGVMATVLGVIVFAGGIAVARRIGRRLFDLRARRVETLSERGTVVGGDMAIRMGLLVVWFGTAIGLLCVLPGVVWAVDGDTEARRVAITLAVIGLGFVAVGVVASLPGQRVLLVEPDRLTRSGLLRERSIAFADVAELRDGGQLPTTTVIGTDGTRIRLSRTIQGFDDLYGRLVAHLPEHVSLGVIEPADPSMASAHDATVVFEVPRRTRRGTVIGFGLGLLFVLAWPWLLVNGEHPVRDAFIFMGVGAGLWALIALLVKAENFPKGQPMRLELTPSLVRWTTLGGGRHERPTNTLVTAAVETTVIYVKGQAGHRHPLRMRFLDGTMLEIGDARARHFRASTNRIESAIQAICLDPASRTMHDRLESNAALDRAERSDSPDTVVDELRTAIARHPDPYRRSLHARVGDLLAGIGRGDEAVSHYRAHLDAFPDDAEAWQALAEVLPKGYRTELHDETVAMAEQLLLTGRARRPDIARPDQTS